MNIWMKESIWLNIEQIGLSLHFYNIKFSNSNAAYSGHEIYLQHIFR